MTTVNDIFKEVDLPKCVDTLLSLHRLHYHEPGYLLDGLSLRHKYHDMVNSIVDTPRDWQDKDTVKFSLDMKSSTYTVTVRGVLLRDINQSIDKISNMAIEHPKTLSKESLVLEILFEISYYDFI
jgi:hypothetical protein